MEDIEYLEEYEDLILPTIQSNRRLVGGSETNSESNMMQDEDSSSIDQDIFESLFDDQSDDDGNNILPKKADPKLSQRGSDDRASLDSLDMLVKDLVGERNSQKQVQQLPKGNKNAGPNPSDTPSSTTAGRAVQKASTSTSSSSLLKNRPSGASSVNKSFNSRTPMNFQRRPIGSNPSSEAAASKSKQLLTQSSRHETSNKFGKSRSVATIRPTVQQQKRFSPASTSTHRNPAQASSSTPKSSRGGLVTLSARKQMSSAAGVGSSRGLPSNIGGPSTRGGRPMQRPTTSIVKFEKREAKVPPEDPLSLDDITDALLDSDSDSFSFSDISDDSLGSMSDLEDTRQIIDISNDSSIDGKMSAKDLENVRRQTPSPTVSDVDKEDEEDSLLRSKTKSCLDSAEKQTKSNIQASESKSYIAKLLHNDEVPTKSTKPTAEKVTILSDTLLTRIDSALMDSAVMDKNKSSGNEFANETHEDVAAELEQELMPFLKKNSRDSKNEDSYAKKAATAVASDEVASKILFDVLTETVFAMDDNTTEEVNKQREKPPDEDKEINENLTEILDKDGITLDGVHFDKLNNQPGDESQNTEHQKENIEVAMEVEIETIKDSENVDFEMSSGNEALAELKNDQQLNENLETEVEDIITEGYEEEHIEEENVTSTNDNLDKDDDEAPSSIDNQKMQSDMVEEDSNLESSHQGLLSKRCAIADESSATSEFSATKGSAKKLFKEPENPRNSKSVVKKSETKEPISSKKRHLKSASLSEKADNDRSTASSAKKFKLEIKRKIKCIKTADPNVTPDTSERTDDISREPEAYEQINNELDKNNKVVLKSTKLLKDNSQDDKSKDQQASNNQSTGKQENTEKLQNDGKSGEMPTSAKSEGSDARECKPGNKLASKPKECNKPEATAKEPKKEGAKYSNKSLDSQASHNKSVRLKQDDETERDRESKDAKMPKESNSKESESKDSTADNSELPKIENSHQCNDREGRQESQNSRKKKSKQFVLAKGGSEDKNIELVGDSKNEISTENNVDKISKTSTTAGEKSEEPGVKSEEKEKRRENIAVVIRKDKRESETETEKSENQSANPITEDNQQEKDKLSEVGKELESSKTEEISSTDELTEPVEVEEKAKKQGRSKESQLISTSTEEEDKGECNKDNADVQTGPFSINDPTAFTVPLTETTTTEVVEKSTENTKEADLEVKIETKKQQVKTIESEQSLREDEPKILQENKNEGNSSNNDDKNKLTLRDDKQLHETHIDKNPETRQTSALPSKAGDEGHDQKNVLKPKHSVSPTRRLQKTKIKCDDLNATDAQKTPTLTENKSSDNYTSTRKSLRSKLVERERVEPPLTRNRVEAEKIVHSHGTRNATKVKAAAAASESTSKKSAPLATDSTRQQQSLYNTRKVSKGKAIDNHQTVAATEGTSIKVTSESAPEQHGFGGRNQVAAVAGRKLEEGRKEDHVKTEIKSLSKITSTVPRRSFKQHNPNTSTKELNSEGASKVKAHAGRGTDEVKKSPETSTVEKQKKSLTSLSFKEWTDSKGVKTSGRAIKEAEDVDIKTEATQKHTAIVSASVEISPKSTETKEIHSEKKSQLQPIERATDNLESQSHKCHEKTVTVQEDDLKNKSTSKEVPFNTTTRSTSNEVPCKDCSLEELNEIGKGKAANSTTKLPVDKRKSVVASSSAPKMTVETNSATGNVFSEASTAKEPEPINENAVSTVTSTIKNSDTDKVGKVVPATTPPSHVSRKRPHKSELEVLIESLPEVLGDAINSSKRRRRENYSQKATRDNFKSPLSLQFKTPPTPTAKLLTTPLQTTANTSLGVSSRKVEPRKAQQSAQKSFPLKVLDVTPPVKHPFVSPTSTPSSRKFALNKPPPENKAHNSAALHTKHLKCRKLRVRLNRSIVRNYYRSLFTTPNSANTPPLGTQVTNPVVTSKLSSTAPLSVKPNAILTAADEQQIDEQVKSTKQQVGEAPSQTVLSPAVTTAGETAQDPANNLSPSSTSRSLGEALIAALELTTSSVNKNSTLQLPPTTTRGGISNAEGIQGNANACDATPKDKSGKTTQNSSGSKHGSDSALVTPLKYNNQSSTQVHEPSQQEQQQKRSARLQQQGILRQQLTATTVRSQSPQLSISSAQNSTSTAQEHQKTKQPIFTPIEPKKELEDEQTPSIPPVNTAAKVLATPTSGSAMISGGVPAAVVDNSGTRLYTFLHPAKYNRSHGAVLLDYCCPNLDGPMPAIDPTREHAQLQSLVRELPAYIVMTTKVVTRADLEAKSNSIPASIRKKMEKLTSAVTSGAATSTSTARPQPAVQAASAKHPPPLTPAPTAASVPAMQMQGTPAVPQYTSTISALQKQLPPTTTLTPKVHPNPTSAPENLPPLTHFGVASVPAASSSQVSNGSALGGTGTVAVSQRPEFLRALLRSNLRRFDMLLKKYSPRIRELTYIERQRIVNEMVNKTTYSPGDVEQMTNLLEEYCQLLNTSLPMTKADTLSTSTKSILPIPTSGPTPAASIAPASMLNSPHSLASAIASQQQNSLHTSAVQKTRTAAGAVQAQLDMAVYDKDKNIIGFQMNNNSGPSVSVMPTHGNAVTRQRLANQSLSSTGTPTLKQPAQESPRIFYTKPMQTSTPITNASVISTASPALDTANRLGRNLTIKQISSKSSPQMSSSTSRNVTLSQLLNQPLRPITTSNSIPRIATITTTTPNTNNTLTTKTSVTLTTKPAPSIGTKRLTRHSAATKAGGQVLIITTKDGNTSSGGITASNDGECILPDDGRKAAEVKEIKREREDDSFLGAS